jgi:zinc protease
MKRPVLALLPVLALMAGALAAPAAAAPTLVRTLENGVRVAVFTDHRLPIVQIQVLVPAGSRAEQSFEGCAARITASLLTRGTTSRNAEQFAHEVEDLGGTVVGDAARDYATLTGAFRSADLEPGLELVADAVMNPLFEDGEFNAARQDLLRRIIESRSHPDEVAEEHAWALAMEGHPYAAPPGGTIEGLAALTRSRVTTFHRAQYRPDHALVAVAGDVDAEKAFAAVRESFGNWGGRTRTVGDPAAEIRKSAGRRIRIVDVPGAPGAELRVVVPVSARSADDAPALVVANDLLGGAAGSRLAGSNMRAVEAYSTLEQQREAGLLVLATSSRPDSVVRALDRLRGALGRFSTSPPTQAEVERARRILARSFPLRNETLGAESAQWLTASSLGLGDDWPDHYPALLQAVTADKVRDVARRYFDPDRADIVVVGPAEALKPALENLGTVEVVSFQEPPVPVATLPAMRMDEPNKASLDEGRKKMQEAIAAHGGLARLKGIKDSIVESDVMLFHSGQAIGGKQVEPRREPLQLWTQTTFVQLQTTQAVHGDTAWTRVSSASADSTFGESPDGVAAMKRAFASDVPHLLMLGAQPRSRVAFRGQDELAGGTADVVEVVGEDGVRWVLFLDPKTHRVLAAEDNQGSALRGSVLRRSFGELRLVQGVLWPHAEERQVDGQRTLTLKTTRIRVNTGVPPSVFLSEAPKTTTTTHPRR